MNALNKGSAEAANDVPRVSGTQKLKQAALEISDNVV